MELHIMNGWYATSGLGSHLPNWFWTSAQRTRNLTVARGTRSLGLKGEAFRNVLLEAEQYQEYLQST